MDAVLNEQIINENKKRIIEKAPFLIGDRLKEIVMFGSCARGDYNEDSDMDIAVIIDDIRDSMSKYTGALVDLSTDIAMENFSVVNFLCIPSEDFNHMKNYELYRNIVSEGIKIYG